MLAPFDWPYPARYQYMAVRLPSWTGASLHSQAYSAFGVIAYPKCVNKLRTNISTAQNKALSLTILCEGFQDCFTSGFAASVLSANSDNVPFSCCSFLVFNDSISTLHQCTQHQRHHVWLEYPRSSKSACNKIKGFLSYQIVTCTWILFCLC